MPLPAGFKEKIIDLHGKGLTKTDIAERLGVARSSVIRALANRAAPKPIAAPRASQTPATAKLEALAAKHNLTPAKIEALIDLIKNPAPQKQFVRHDHGKIEFCIGLIGDTHIGSKHSDYGILNDIYDRFKKAGIAAAYHFGDITEGYGRRKGQSYECELHGADEQVGGVVKRYPRIQGVTTHFITGDHDGWHYDSAGVDVGRAIAKYRKDLNYLGAFQAQVQLAPKTSLMLMHPATGTAYAISYKPQKIIESLAGGDKPNILGIGHFHKMEYLFYRNIHCFQTGTTERQTPWMKRMNISAHIGAWIVRVNLRKDGTVDRLRMEALTYY